MIKVLIIILSLSFFSFIKSEVDPFQNLNEKTHNLNQSLDKSIATPIAKVYRKLTPDFVELGITNFTDNIEDVNIALNNLLQAKIKDGLSDILRFTINSTIGVLGFFDVASSMGLQKHSEDFGQTLAVWGVSDVAALALCTGALARAILPSPSDARARLHERPRFSRYPTIGTWLWPRATQSSGEHWETSCCTRCPHHGGLGLLSSQDLFLPDVSDPGAQEIFWRRNPRH